jgi:hypothetical protein
MFKVGDKVVGVPEEVALGLVGDKNSMFMGRGVMTVIATSESDGSGEQYVQVEYPGGWKSAPGWYGKRFMLASDATANHKGDYDLEYDVDQAVEIAYMEGRGTLPYRAAHAADTEPLAMWEYELLFDHKRK